MIFPGGVTGLSPQSSWCTRVDEALKQLEVKPGVGYRTKKYRWGTILEIDQHGGSGKGGISITRYSFQSHGVGADTDYILCTPADDPTATPVKVLKPYLLRFSITSRNGVTYANFDPVGQTRQATNANGSVTQYITPIYFLGDIIYASTSTDKPVSLVDLNLDARVFAAP